MAPPRVPEIYSRPLFFSFILFSSFLTQITPLNGPSRTMAQMTRICARMCLLGVRIFKSFVWGSFSPKTPKKSARNREIPAKIVKKYLLNDIIRLHALYLKRRGFAQGCVFRGQNFQKYCYGVAFVKKNSPKSARNREIPAKIVKNIS